MISGIAEVSGAFLWCECVEGPADFAEDGFGSARRGAAQKMLQLGEHLFDRVEIGGVFGQEEQLGAGGADRLAYGLAFVTAEIVDDDDIAGLQGGDENLLDVSAEARAIDGAVEHPWGIDTIMAQGGQEGHGLPAALRNLGVEPLTARRPPPERRHVGLGPGLVDEDQALRRDAVLILDPLCPPAGDVGAILFAGVHGFF